MVVLHAKRKMQVGEAFPGKSIIGTECPGKIDREVTVGGISGICPIISERAWITGTRQHALDPTKPFPQGNPPSSTRLIPGVDPANHRT